MPRKTKMAACVALMGASAPSGFAAAETLYDVLQEAYANHPSVQARTASLEAQRELVEIAKSRMLPTLDASASYNLSRRYNYNYRTPEEIRHLSSNSSSSTTKQSQLVLRGSYPLYNGGQSANALSRQEAEFHFAEGQVDQQSQQYILQVITAYFDVLRDREVFQLSYDTFEVLREQYKAAKIRFEVGEVTITDVAQAKSRMAAARSNVIQAQGRVAASKASFVALVGREPNSPKTPLAPPPLPASKETAIEEALANNPAIRTARAAEEVASYQIREALGSKLPSLSLDGNLSRTGTDGNNRLNTTYSGDVGITLSAPVYRGGQLDANVRMAKHRARQRRLEYRAAIVDARQQASVAWESYVTAKAAIQSGIERVRAASLAYEGVNEELKVGSRATIDVLNAEQELLNARTALVSAARDLHVSAYTLLARIGHLGPLDLGLQERYAANVEAESAGGPEWQTPWRP